MKYFYDTEFLEDGRTIDLISIAIVAEDGREYYAVNSELPMGRIREHDWLLRNVMPSLPIRGKASLDSYVATPRNHFPRPSVELLEVDLTATEVKPKFVIANEVRDFLIDDPELWAWYAAYDHVCLAQLFGTMLNLPPHVPMWTNDLQQEAHRLGVTELPKQPKGVHNALEDARFLKSQSEYLRDPATTP